MSLMNADDVIEAVHRYPIEGFVHYLDRRGTCVCGPHIVMIEDEPGHDIPMYTHMVWDPPSRMAADTQIISVGPDYEELLESLLDDDHVDGSDDDDGLDGLRQSG